MLKDRTKFHVVAGEALVSAMAAETQARCKNGAYGYDSEQLCKLQRERAGRGVLGVEIVKSNYGHSVRYDSGLQEFGLLASCRLHSQLDGTLESAERFVCKWVAEDPANRYAWRRL